MKRYFRNVECETCGASIDPIVEDCPNCGHHRSKTKGLESFKNYVKIKWLKQLICFAIGWAGFQIAGLTIQTIAIYVYAALNSDLTGEALTDATSKFIGGPIGMMIVNTIAYAIVLTALLILNFKDKDKFFLPFAKGKSWAAGGIGFIVLFIFSYIIAVITSFIFPSSGANANQSVLVEIVTKYPVVGFLVFGICGPICEEITYRVGLFGLLSRWHKVGAYIVTILIFAFIHFGWSTIIQDPSQLGNELINIPSYIVAGAILCFIYDRFGFGASVLAHISYNLLACAMMFIK